ncbi:hypothetical protein [Cysteiniphilum sp. JM-1]|uniref:hypothetical protein n=1 Tax=Cysteiniphilum sp. JM-1 TaxID=2610891 RepID=UPI001244D15F|nr:hypothetical protein [Cysteiniphilum sp. JM-1]
MKDIVDKARAYWQGYHNNLLLTILQQLDAQVLPDLVEDKDRYNATILERDFEDLLEQDEVDDQMILQYLHGIYSIYLPSQIIYCMHQLNVENSTIFSKLFRLLKEHKETDVVCNMIYQINLLFEKSYKVSALFEFDQYQEVFKFSHLTLHEVIRNYFNNEITFIVDEEKVGKEVNMDSLSPFKQFVVRCEQELQYYMGIKSKNSGYVYIGAQQIQLSKSLYNILRALWVVSTIQQQVQVDKEHGKLMCL